MCQQISRSLGQVVDNRSLSDDSNRLLERAAAVARELDAQESAAGGVLGALAP
jgi:hypothetical protein